MERVMGISDPGRRSPRDRWRFLEKLNLWYFVEYELNILALFIPSLETNCVPGFLNISSMNLKQCCRCWRMLTRRPQGRRGTWESSSPQTPALTWGLSKSGSKTGCFLEFHPPGFFKSKIYFQAGERKAAEEGCRARKMGSVLQVRVSEREPKTIAESRKFSQSHVLTCHS